MKAEDFKIVLYAFLAFAILYNLNNLAKTVGGFFGAKNEEEERKETEKKERELKQISGVRSDPKKFTYSPAAYSNIASALKQAMKGWGTDEKSIERQILLLRTTEDVKAVIDAFGIFEGKNLFEWLRDELPATDKVFGQ